MQVLNVEPGSPAELAGLRPTLQSQQGILLGDEILAVDGKDWGDGGMGTFLNKNWPEKPIVWGI
jgi:C-terminal processing protease CtpA/Prc